jgi:hypothetical protein
MSTLGNPKYYNGSVPLGVSIFPKELAVLPERSVPVLLLRHARSDQKIVPISWHHTLGPIVYSARHKSGGHFAAYERPKELVEDIRNTFKSATVRAKL